MEHLTITNSTRSSARSRSRTSSPRWRSKAAQESSLSYLNAGRGNPNWVATEPREAFFLLGQFAVTESKRVLDLPPGVGGMPKAAGIAGRLEAWLTKHAATCRARPSCRRWCRGR